MIFNVKHNLIKIVINQFTRFEKMKKNFLGSKMICFMLSAAALTTFSACDDEENTPQETDGGLKVITEIVTDGNVIGNGYCNWSMCWSR